MQLDGTTLKVADTSFDVSASRLYVIGVGKAATAMARGLEQAVGNLITEGIISDPLALDSLNPPRWQTFAGGHPLPNDASLKAARAAFKLLDKANAEESPIIFLVSGGGSAMMEWPASESISLDDLRTANQRLVSCGASIVEINAVRREFSAVKGGKLAERAPRSHIVSIIVSDTNSGDEATVASGPTLPPSVRAPLALDVIRKHRLESDIPHSIVEHLQQKAREHQQRYQREHPHYVILDNQVAVEAATRKASGLGFVVDVATEISEQPIDMGCELLLKRAQLASSAQTCIVSGGEFSCPVKGDGRGGRNLETALRCALIMDEQRPDYLATIISVGTDGIDGNTPAAGAIADIATSQRAKALGLNGRAFLERSDSYTFFEKLGDLIVTGPTGTNVRDLRVLLKQTVKL